MEADPPHLVPFRRSLLQEGGQAAGARDRLPHPAFQAPPDALQCPFGEILAAVHGRGGQNPASTVGAGQGLDLEGPGILGNVAQSGEIALRELLPVAHARPVPGRDLVRREGEERLAPIALEGMLQRLRSGQCGLICGGFPAQMSRRRQSYAHALVVDQALFGEMQGLKGVRMLEDRVALLDDGRTLDRRPRLVCRAPQSRLAPSGARHPDATRGRANHSRMSSRIDRRPPVTSRSRSIVERPRAPVRYLADVRFGPPPPSGLQGSGRPAPLLPPRTHPPV